MTTLVFLRINKSATYPNGAHPIINVEIHDALPADQTIASGEVHTFRAQNEINRQVTPVAGAYMIAVGSSGSALLGTDGAADQYFDMFGNVVEPAFIADQVQP